MDSSELRERAFKGLETVSSADALEAWRIQYLGRKSELSAALRSLAKKSDEEKRALGPAAQSIKKELEKFLQEKLKSLRAKHSTLNAIDITRPGCKPSYGHLHPLTIIENDIKRIFRSMNFGIIEGPEIETEYYNFDALNMPKYHPARDMQDTLWINREKGWLLRTQTSPVQIRYMEKHAPPVRIIVPGRVFRAEATDASHEINFYQFEGLMVGQGVSLANFKWIVTEFCEQFFEKSVEIRFRPSYFPFTEPSVEVDVRLPGGKWLEVMGAGMVHPKVFKAVGYDSRRVQGFAFGGGMDRFAMIKYNIPDIRLFYSGDLRLIKQL